MTKIPTFYLVNKELFTIEKNGEYSVWMLSSFDDDQDNTWYNLYDYNHIQKTGEFLPYFNDSSIHSVLHFGHHYKVLTFTDLHKKMEESEFTHGYFSNI